jgi:hypothetical protein
MLFHILNSPKNKHVGITYLFRKVRGGGGHLAKKKKFDPM